MMWYSYACTEGEENMKIKKSFLPGIAVTLLVSVVAKYLAIYLPFIGAESLAMLMGILLGNTVLTQSKLNSGVKWSEKYPIEIGIALLGLTVTLKTIESLGINGILFIVLQMLLTIIVAIVLGKRVFKVSKKSSLLMAAGNAVCGSSAIAAVSPEIKANDDERRTAVATVSLVGIVLLIILPIVGPVVLGKQDLLLGALIGGTLQSVGQVVGTASLINQDVTTYATLFKMLRVILLSVVVISFARMAQGKSQKTAQPKKSVSQYIKVPWFILAFIIFILINSYVSLPTQLTHSAKELTSFSGVINLAGIGLNLKLKTIKDSGSRFLGYGLLISLLQVVGAISLIKLLF